MSQAMKIDNQAAQMKARRSAWEADHGAKVGASAGCPTRRLTGRHQRDRSCCWWYLSVFDHTYNITVAGTGVRGLVTMPYGLDSERVAQLDAFCAATVVAGLVTDRDTLNQARREPLTPGEGAP